MQGTARNSASWAMKLVRLRRQRRVQNLATLGLVLLGPILALLTFLALGPLEQTSGSTGLRLILLADIVYILLVAGLVAQRVARMVAARRAHSAGSRLHMRLTGVFVVVALVPTVLVAVFAMLTVNVGLEGWFSDRVRNVLSTSLAAAEAYEDEHRRDLAEDVEALAGYLNDFRRRAMLPSDGTLREVLTQGQGQIQRGIREAYVIDGGGELRARGERSYLFDYEQPTPEQIRRAAGGETVIIEDWDNNEFRALVTLDQYVDRYLYVSRSVDGEILNLLDDTKQTVGLYQQLEHERGRLLFEFGLLYLGFAAILLLAAIWLGLWFAERLSRPVGRLAGAAQRVGSGDLDVHVQEEPGDDEIAMLGRVFNQMTRQLKGQREALLEAHQSTEERRRLFDSVLHSVTAGVLGLDPGGRVLFLNRAGQRMLDLPGLPQGTELALAVPEFAPLFERLQQADSNEAVQEQIRVSRGGRPLQFLVRIAMRQNSDGAPEGYVVAFDDVSDLVSAQRMAAWGDVARRIAHEIKNPLTPIQLSAERIRRRFRQQLGDEDAATLEQYTEVIIRQTGDLRRIVDEFSKFARMPEPDRREQDLTRIVRDAVVLQQNGQPDVTITASIPGAPLTLDLDATMISQALTNLIKNAGEAIETRQEAGGSGPDYRPEIRVTLEETPEAVTIRVIDNGSGLPEDRDRLFEPYVTTRDKGTGLGLPIVKKIIEEHGGTLALLDAPPFSEGAHPGAMAEIRLPRQPRNEARGSQRRTKDRAANG